LYPPVKSLAYTVIGTSLQVNLCRAVFRDTLNENRDADRGDGGRYSCRFYLKHNFLEQAFDMLIDAGFELKAACGLYESLLSEPVSLLLL